MSVGEFVFQSCILAIYFCHPQMSQKQQHNPFYIELAKTVICQIWESQA